jgi:putative Mg2+ transporter-C (MgtC) family protein
MTLDLLRMIGVLLLAAFLGGLVGWERERRDRPAGLRTHILVCLGSALITLVSIHLSGTRFDPGRIAAQIVSGIGFLGAGTIIQGRGSVRGLTTAATLWLVASIGLGIGLGAYWAVALTVVVGLVLLWPIRELERRLPYRTAHLSVVANGMTVDDVIAALDRPADHISFRQEGQRVSVTLRTRTTRGGVDAIVTRLARTPGIAAVGAPRDEE